jgi:hypothetical protein
MRNMFAQVKSPYKPKFVRASKLADEDVINAEFFDSKKSKYPCKYPHMSF